jgi:hypothetical protein
MKEHPPLVLANPFADLELPVIDPSAVEFVQDGVPLYDVQALLGDEDYATTQRYAHLAPGAHDKVLESWARRRDASVTHGQKEARPSR